MISKKIAALAIIAWLAVGLVIGFQRGRRVGQQDIEPHLAQCTGDHVGCSQLLIDLELENAQLHDDLEMQYRNIDLLEGQYLDAVDELSQVDVPIDDIRDVCLPYEFVVWAALIEDVSDFVEVGLYHADAAQHLLICAKLNRQYLGDIFNHLENTIEVLEFALSDLDPDWELHPVEPIEPGQLPIPTPQDNEA